MGSLSFQYLGAEQGWALQLLPVPQAPSSLPPTSMRRALQNSEDLRQSDDPVAARHLGLCPCGCQAAGQTSMLGAPIV